MIVRESLIGFTRGGDIKANIGIGREKLLGDFVESENQKGLSNPKHFKLDIDKKQDIFYTAIKNQRNDIVRLLMSDPSVNVAHRKNKPISDAAAAGNLEAVEMMLKDERINPADNNCDALAQAVIKGFYPVVDILLEDPRINPAVSRNKLDKDFKSVEEPNYIIKLAGSYPQPRSFRSLMKNPDVDLTAGLKALMPEIRKLEGGSAIRKECEDLARELLDHPRVTLTPAQKDKYRKILE